MNMLGLYYPMDSFWHHIDPRSKLFLTISLMILLFSSNTSLILLTAILTFLLYSSAKIPIKLLIKPLVQLRWLLWITLLINLLFPWGYPSILLMILKNGSGAIVTVSKLSIVFLLAAWLSYTTKPFALVDGISRLLKPFSKLFPMMDLSLLMSLVIRFVPELFQESQNITVAQQLRGLNKAISWQEGGRWIRCTMIPILIACLRRSAAMALAMETRGYRVGVQRTPLTDLVLRKADYLIIALALILISISFVKLW